MLCNAYSLAVTRAQYCGAGWEPVERLYAASLRLFLNRRKGCYRF